MAVEEEPERITKDANPASVRGAGQNPAITALFVDSCGHNVSLSRWTPLFMGSATTEGSRIELLRAHENPAPEPLQHIQRHKHRPCAAGALALFAQHERSDGHEEHS
jgi:hypothetical protein